MVAHSRSVYQLIIISFQSEVKILEMELFYPKSPFLFDRDVELLIIEGNNCNQEVFQWLCLTPRITTYRVNLIDSSLAEFQTKVEAVLSIKYLSSPPPVFSIPQLPEVLCIGPVNDSDDFPQPNSEKKEVIVDSSCAASLLRGAHIYAPGVLSMETGTQLGEEVQVYADLEGRCKKGTNVRYESARKVFIGLGTARMQRHQLYSSNIPITGVAIEMNSTISRVPTIGDLSNQHALLQNLPSIVCVRVLDPRPGECVLDMCAAPGNKTTHIAELMHNEGILVALDKSASKIKRLNDRLSHGLHNVHVFAYDATIAYKESATSSAPFQFQPPFASATFDRILLDAPCSALGNRPLLAIKGMSPKMLASYPRVQRKLFDAAVPMLKPGGVLVYSTCTVTSAENESMVAWTLLKFPELQLVDAMPKLGGAGLRNLGLDEQQRRCVQRFGPMQDDDVTISQLDVVGFFIAKFQKRS